ncbi:MAG: hypothetical protein IGR93_17050 [Hydrococcus sp. C42_A2020_068]|nr:hypothetical protein [Hydrococcus sp. C42_A2020_068]
MLASIKTLLSSIVDYAGLFPPAKLGMREAMANYDRDRMSSYNWMLGRFVLPASRLNEFEELLPAFSSQQWSIAIILSGNLESEMERVQSISDGGKIKLAALEFPPLPPDEIESVFPNLAAGVDAFFEIPLDGNLEAYLAALQYADALAKIRTGSTTAEAFPTASQLSHYIVSFAEAQVPFKATAGLHHPLPGNYPLNYEPQSNTTAMHGFLNVAIAAALTYWQKITREEALAILQESSIEGFRFAEDGISWASHHLNLSEIERARQRFFRSFGSCSFQEPIDDLKTLKLLS